MSDLAVVRTNPVELPEPVARRGVTEAQWRTLCHSLYPGADPQSVLMVIDYCIARRLDPLKKPCHIVPMRTKDQKTGEWGWRDVVMPGIYELRTTAQRAGGYLGHTQAVYGPLSDYSNAGSVPMWCEMVFKRHTAYGIAEFPVRRYFAEVVGLTKEGKVNDRWSRAPIQMLEKVVEAAGLREAFPDEFGGEHVAEEMDSESEREPAIVQAPVLPAQRKSQQVLDEVHPHKTRAVLEAIAAKPVTPVATIVPEADADIEPVEEPAAPPAPPLAIGVIVRVTEKTVGDITTATVALDTGFVCATRNAELIAGAKRHEAAKSKVELVTKTPKDPRYARTLQEILPGPVPA